MDWLNLHTSTLDSPEFLGAEPVQRASWLCLLRFCCGQENGGRIVGAAGWSDRKWQQLVRITKEEASQPSDLWAWEGDDLLVAFYPADREALVQEKRKAGKAGGQSRTDAKADAARRNGESGGRKITQAETEAKTQAEPKQNPSENPTEGKSKGRVMEGEGNARANEAQADPEDIFQPAQPQPAKPTQPKATPQDLLSACGYALDWFRGSESGRQEAHDAMTGALALYDPQVIQKVLRDEFKARKAKVHISHLLGLLDARTYVEQAPPGELERMAAEKAAKEVRCADLRARLARVWPGDAEWERVTGRKMSLHGAQSACDFAANWIQEQLAEHYGEVFK